MPRGPIGREKGVRYEQWRNPEAELGGVVKISGSFILDHEEDVLNLVKHEGKLAEQRNSHARLKKIEKTEGGILVETTDHNLALRIGKALHRAYKGEHRFNFREGEKFAEVYWKRD
ncbi:MAG: hypothetical protein V3T21_04420 [Candidatus Margulisiibacteriota bacterium]